jgi:hypothetical protein
MRRMIWSRADSPARSRVWVNERGGDNAGSFRLVLGGGQQELGDGPTNARTAIHGPLGNGRANDLTVHA